MEGKKAVSYEMIGRTKHFFPIVEKNRREEIKEIRRILNEEENGDLD